MRVPIAVQVEPYDPAKDQPRIDAARQAFVTYLQGVFRKSTQTKHGLMGPVGKILNEVKSGRRDPGSLKGYALRVHEATRRLPSASGLEALEKGIDLLVGVLNDAPITAHDHLLDRLNYGLFYDLRKEQVQGREAWRQAWIKFLRDKYKTERAVSDAWGEEVTSFEALYPPRKVDGSLGKTATTKQRDVAIFCASQGAAEIPEDEEE